jgi:hypothetical protein
MDYKCECQEDFGGINCDTNYNCKLYILIKLHFKFKRILFNFKVNTPCSSSPCLNDAACVDLDISTYKCICSTHFSGVNCENEISINILILSIDKNSVTDKKI